MAVFGCSKIFCFAAIVLMVEGQGLMSTTSYLSAILETLKSIENIFYNDSANSSSNQQQTNVKIPNKSKNKLQQTHGVESKKNPNNNVNKTVNSNKDGGNENTGKVVDIKLPSRRVVETANKKIQKGNEQSIESEEEGAHQSRRNNINHHKNNNINVNKNVNFNKTIKDIKNTKRSLDINQTASMGEDGNIKEQEPKTRLALNEPVEESSEESR